MSDTMSGETKIRLIEGEIAALNLGPNDHLVVTVDERATEQELLQIRDGLTSWAPDVKCLVIRRGDVELSVVRKTGGIPRPKGGSTPSPADAVLGSPERSR